MSKTLVIGSAVAVGALVIYKMTDAAKQIQAAHKLQISFKNLQIKNVSLNKGILFNVFFNASNPTPTTLTFSQPYVQISITNNNGNMSPIAISDNAKEKITLAGMETNPISVSLQITPLQALKLPNLFKYLFQRYLGTQKVPIKKILVEYNLTSEGINISGKKDVFI